MVSHTVMVRREGPYRIVSCQREDWKISGERNDGCRRRAHLDDDDNESDLWFFLPRSLLILLRARTKSSLPDQEARFGFSRIRARNRYCGTGVGGGRVLPSEMDNVFTTFSRRTGDLSSPIMSSCKKFGSPFLYIRRTTEERSRPRMQRHVRGDLYVVIGACRSSRPFKCLSLRHDSPVR